jgi:iron complex outermembrane receptor protein
MNVEGYVLLSPRLGFRARQWQAWFWSRNVTDTHYFNYLTAQPWGSGLIVGEPGNPRTFGATLAVQF